MCIQNKIWIFCLEIWSENKERKWLSRSFAHELLCGLWAQRCRLNYLEKPQQTSVWEITGYPLWHVSKVLLGFQVCGASVMCNPSSDFGNAVLKMLITSDAMKRIWVKGHGNPLQCSFPQNPMDRGAWWAMVHRAEKSQTQLKRLSMHTWQSPTYKWESACLDRVQIIEQNNEGKVRPATRCIDYHSHETVFSIAILL